MNFVEPHATMVLEKDPLIKIEKMGRICYKSENENYTTETAKKFYNSLINSGHLSVLEHATFIFKVHDIITYERAKRNRFLNCSHVVDYYVSGNLRAIFESEIMGLIVPLLSKYPDLEHKKLPKSDKQFYRSSSEVIESDVLLDFKMESEVMKHRYYTVVFETDRGVSHEMVRHRLASFSQESTRYCNYSKDKFGHELTFVKPFGSDEWTNEQKYDYVEALKAAEKSYFNLIASGLSPQQARGVLPTDLKTTIAVTMNLEGWKHFFDLRYHGVTGKPHPNMKQVADLARQLFLFRGYTNL